jgi:release factor glutamine methyltransferase
MRKLLKKGISFFLVPAVRWYLRKPRRHRYRGTDVLVFPGVFHPGLFSSTHFLLDYLATRDISHKSVLELGCGTGLISIWASGQGAVVTAVDLSHRAVENTLRNAKAAQLSVRVLASDLFDALDGEMFDWIVINPPYYSRPVRNEADLAWNCGEGLEYFHRLFATLHRHIHSETEVIIILTQTGCDLPGIYRAAEKHSLYFEMIKERSALLDGKDFLFRIRRFHGAAAEAQA